MKRVDDFRSEEKSVSRRGLSDLIGRGGGTREHSGGLHLAVVVARSSRFVARKARDNWNERISINPTPGRGYIQVRSGAQRVVVHTATLADQPAKHCQAGNKRGGQKNLQHRYRTAMNPQWWAECSVGLSRFPRKVGRGGEGATEGTSRTSV